MAKRNSSPASAGEGQQTAAPAPELSQASLEAITGGGMDAPIPDPTQAAPTQAEPANPVRARRVRPRSMTFLTAAG